jgi:hypothetical protein
VIRKDRTRTLPAKAAQNITLKNHGELALANNLQQARRFKLFNVMRNNVMRNVMREM